MPPVQTFAYEDVELAYRVSGSGPALILLHGWPFHKETFRKVLPLLEPHFTCYALDAAGMGDSGWSEHTSFSLHAHAERVRAFADHVGLDRYSVLAHDTGATIARLLGAQDTARVQKLVLLDTECPRHRPPFIPLIQRVVGTGLGRLSMKLSARSQSFLRSRMGFGGCFVDERLLDREFKRHFVDHWMKSSHHFLGMVSYLRGIDFGIIDALDAVHAKIQAPVLFIWGAEDPIFPRKVGEAMANRMPTCRGFVPIERTRFLLHEERPQAVAEHVLAFLE